MIRPRGHSRRPICFTIRTRLMGSTSERRCRQVSSLLKKGGRGSRRAMYVRKVACFSRFGRSLALPTAVFQQAVSSPSHSLPRQAGWGPNPTPAIRLDQRDSNRLRHHRRPDDRLLDRPTKRTREMLCDVSCRAGPTSTHWRPTWRGSNAPTNRPRKQSD